MNVTTTFAAALLLSAIVTTPALAQGSPPVLLTPENASRWEAAGYTGWRGVSKNDIAPSSNQWADAAALGVSVGYYWTSHLKSELDVALTNEADLFAQEPLTFSPPAVYRFGNYRLRTASVSGGFAYQFGENAWFHPFLGGGVETRRERSQLELLEQRPCERIPCLPIQLPVETVVAYETRPFVTGGFKWYFGEGAFIRSDIRAMVSSDGAEAVLWRIGIGADF
jgi:hypothetical protein